MIKKTYRNDCLMSNSLVEDYVQELNLALVLDWLAYYIQRNRQKKINNNNDKKMLTDERATMTTLPCTRYFYSTLVCLRGAVSFIVEHANFMHALATCIHKSRSTLRCCCFINFFFSFHPPAISTKFNFM